ncbi:unnamed protein product [Rotaria socialis]|uniref:Uncharacterized protein n=1 Tax=Rotaria socialis TaxID=392032 RepID=A0A818SQZ4_9BILA|nr:unnamed protein product [Rotaria socialis]
MHINCSCYLFLKIEITKQMNKKQIELIELWIRSPKPPTNVLSPRENQQQIRSPSSYTPDSIPSCIFDEPGNEIEIIASESSCSSSNVADIQHVSSSIEYETSNKSNLNKNQYQLDFRYNQFFDTTTRNAIYYVCNFQNTPFTIGSVVRNTLYWILPVVFLFNFK